MPASEPRVEYSTKSKVRSPEPAKAADDVSDLDDFFASLANDETGGDDTAEVIEALCGDDTWKPLKSVSDKVTGRKRRSDKKDRELLERIRKFKLPETDTPEASFSSDPSTHPTPPIPSTSTTPTPPPLCVWDHVSDRVKLACSTIALQVWFEPTSWTFNLTPEAQAKALAHPKGFTKSLALALNRKLKDRLGYVPLYWFAVHVTKDGRAHLHGAISLGAGDDLPGLAEIMRDAWGEWRGPGKAYQVDLNPQRCDDGWADYAFNGRAAARALLGEHTLYIPDELRRRGEFVYGELRAMMMPRMTLSA